MTAKRRRRKPLLKRGQQYPWTDAMTESRWKRWVWVTLSVLKVLLVIALWGLVGWGIQALIDRQGAMEASEVIALTAVVVTGAGAAFTVAAGAWLGKRRITSEERMHTERLEHDRAEAVRQSAAVAYASAYRLLWKLPGSWSDRQVNAVSGELAIVMAVGWTPAVRVRARKLDEEMDSIMFAINSDGISDWDDTQANALELLERYRNAIAM